MWCKQFLFFLFFIGSATLPEASFAQKQTFEEALSKLYFGIDLENADGYVVDTLIKVPVFHHHKRVFRQRGLAIHMQKDGSEEVWSERHIFNFSQSPLKEFKIKSGSIGILITRSKDFRTLKDINWSVRFEDKTDAELFFAHLVKTFEPLSSEQRTGYDQKLGYVTQYATTDDKNKRIRDVAFYLGKSRSSGNYEISITFEYESPE